VQTQDEVKVVNKTNSEYLTLVQTYSNCEIISAEILPNFFHWLPVVQLIRSVLCTCTHAPFFILLKCKLLQRYLDGLDFYSMFP
jgi:hypothetical protein